LLDSPAGESRADARNRAFRAASGAFVGPLEAGDILDPAALLAVADAVQADPATLIVFTDEDRAGSDNQRDRPWFKPDYSPDAMLAGNAIGRLALFEARLVEGLGGFRTGSSPWEEYDLALRAAVAAGPAHVRHIPAVLCHRNEVPGDWPVPSEALARGAPMLDVVPGGAWPRVRPRLPDPAPLVSVIVPTKDRADLLAACTQGLLNGTDYPALELLVVDNDSTEPSALALLADLGADPRVRVLREPGPFNFSAMNNVAVRAARGSVLALLNNDIEICDPGWLAEMAAHAVRPDVGLVGARLLYQDGTLQHGGMVLGPDGSATHLLRGAARDDRGYAGQLACTRDLAAVTAACLTIRREIWQQVGGMNEELPVAWNDVDLCQRVRARGLRVVWTPFATLLHLEGETRGIDAADAERQSRFLADQARYRASWGQAAAVDPFLNPNLVATDHQLCLGPPPRRLQTWQSLAFAHG
jgi:GT2 family glycosyltransferase